MSELLWQLTEVTVPGRGRPRLDQVSVDIPSGVTAVVGASGAGKTTLLNLLVDFERPASGMVTRMESSDKRRLPVFWAPPGHGLWPHLTVRNHVASIMPNRANGQVEALLRAFDLESLSAAYPATLSQGERDRLALARAIASDAHILVLDEPLAHLPIEAAQRYWSQLQAACVERKISIVMATHDASLAERESDWTIRLDNGRLVSAGKRP
jgi:ABC-type multidrug transport system ATPase subunit